MYYEDLEFLTKGLVELQAEAAVKAILLFCADKNRPDIFEIEEVLKFNTKPLIGGIFPEILADGQRKESGFLLVPLFQELEVLVVEAKDHETVSHQLSTQLNTISKDFQSVFCFLNSLWKEKTIFIQELYNELGPFVTYLGGGAGSLNFESFPCAFANQHVYENAAVLGFFKNDISMGVAHGWKKISDPIKVTASSGNTIVSLDWKPAFDVYKSHVEKHSNKLFTKNNFFEISKSYPLGLVKLEGEMIVRDPFAAKNNSLQILDEVPEGEYVSIMHGDISSLLYSAKNAVEISSQSGFSEFTQFCVDCISRVLFMETEFDKELAHLNAYQPINGVLAIGEIANLGNSVLEVFNKTIVVAQWKENC